MSLVYFLVNLLLLGMLAQELSQQQVFQFSLSTGEWSNSQNDTQVVSRYYICGAQMNRYVGMQSQPQKCQVHCRKRWSKGKRRCAWQTSCYPQPDKLLFERSNGLRFKFCHFQKWDDQITQAHHGDWQWKGMKMCPKNHYVSGFQTKLSERDGIAGLIIHCTNPLLIAEKAAVLVMEGDGQWLPPHHSNSFSNSFRVKSIDGYINGVEMSFNIFPYIYSFNIKYSIPKDLKSEPVTIDTATVVNYGKGNMKKIIELSGSKQIQRIWQNEKMEMHGQAVSRTFSQSLSVKNNIQVPHFKTEITMTLKKEITTSVYSENAEKFMFGTAEKVTIGRLQRDEVDVAPCTKKTINQIVYSANVDIPYVVEIGFTNGIAKAVDLIKGYFRGVLTSSVETIIYEEPVC